MGKVFERQSLKTREIYTHVSDRYIKKIESRTNGVELRLEKKKRDEKQIWEIMLWDHVYQKFHKPPLRGKWRG